MNWLLPGTGSWGARRPLQLSALSDPGCRSCSSATPVKYQWAQYTADEWHPVGCDTRGHRAPAAHLLSQSPLSFPKQTHYDFRNLVTYLLPLFPSPCAIGYFFVFFFLDTAPISQGMLGCCIGVWTRCSGVSASSCGCPGATIAGDVAWRPFSSFPVLRAWFLWNNPTRAVKHFHNKKHSE